MRVRTPAKPAGTVRGVRRAPRARAAARRALALVAGATVVLASPARAADREEDLRRALDREIAKGVSQSSDLIQYDQAAGRGIFAGNFALAIGSGVLLYADAVVIWGLFAPGGQIVRPREIYAEGDVFLQLFGQTFEAERLYVDFLEGRGQLARATVRSRGPPPALGLGPRFRFTALLARAERARLEGGFGAFLGEDALVSTCTFGVPHFGLGADAVRVTRRGPLLGEADEETAPGAWIELYRPRLQVYGRTVLAFPMGLVWDTDWTPYVPRVRAGSSSRFGEFALVTVPLYVGGGLGIRAKADYMSERGGATGGTAEWSGPPGDRETFRGFFDGYYVHDEGDEDRTSGLAPPREDRGRVRLFHREELPFGLRREIELSWISERGFLTEYYEREARTGKEQETAAYVRWLHENMGATALGRWRLNDFQTQVEYLPRGRYSWIGEPFLQDVLPFGRGFYLTSALELSAARRRFDEALLEPATPKVWRADLEERLDYPVPLGPFQLDPFAVARCSAFSERFANEDAIQRRSAGAGATATTDVWRTFEGEIALLGLDGLRHMMTVSSGFEALFYNDVAPDELWRIDRLEAVRECAYVPISLRNRLQGSRGEESVDLVDLLVETRFFPDPSRPAPLGTVADPLARRRWDTLYGDLRLNPIDSLSLRLKSEWDPEGNGRVRTDGSVLFRFSPVLSGVLSYRSLKGLYDAVEVGGDVRASEKWGFYLGSQYDFERGGFVRQRLAVRRFFHRFVFEVTLDEDLTTDDLRVSVNFMPLELFGAESPFGGGIDRGLQPDF